MTQKDHWAWLRPILEAEHVHPLRVEDPRAKGVPDVNTSIGWIELKQLKAFPKRESSPVDVGLSENQQRFIRRRIGAGQPVFISLAVGAEHFLLHGPEVLFSISEGIALTQARIREIAVATGKRGYAQWVRERKHPHRRRS